MKPLPILKPLPMFNNAALEQFLKVCAVIAFLLFLGYFIIRPQTEKDDDDDKYDQDRFDPPAIKLG